MQKHPFPGKLEKNLLETITRQGSVEIINGLLDKAGAIHKRPGLFFTQTINAVNGIQALYYWPAKEKIVAVAGGQVYAASNLADPLIQVSNYTAMLNPGTVRIADTGHWLYICSETGPMIQWNGVDEAIRVADGAAPINVSSVAVLNQRVVANELGTNRFWYTDPPSLTAPTAALVWSGYLEVGRTSEDIIGLGVAGNELIVFKNESLQAFYDDGSTPYRPITGSQHFFGLISASAFCKYEDALFFVSPDRQIRQLLNREIQNIGIESLATALDKLSEISTVTVFPLERWVVFNFHTDNLTYVYDPVLASWTQFSTFSQGADKAFLARNAASLPATNETSIWAVGANTGSMYMWDRSAYTDAGNPIHFKVRTAQQDWETGVRKHTTRLIVKVSTEAVRTANMPALNLPGCMRCVLYNFSTTLPLGVTAAISGLPTGLTASQVGQVFSITGTVTDYAGEKAIIVTLTDTAGRQYIDNRTFSVADKTGITVGVM